jgi:hypothetical protein
VSLPKPWIFSLVDSSDLSTLAILRSGSGHSLDLEYNRPGTFRMTLPIDDPHAYRVERRSTAIIAARPPRTIWSGPVTMMEESVGGGEDVLNITCTGWFEESDHRHIWPSDLPVNFENQVGGVIASSLINIINAQEDTAARPAPLHIRPGWYSDTQLRSISYDSGQNIGSAIRDLMTIENGFDILTDPLTRQINFRDNTEYEDRTSVHYGYGVFPGGLQLAKRTTDGIALANRMSVVSSGGVVVPADDQDAIDFADVMLETWESLSDVGDTNIVAAYANAELVYRRYGVTTYDITPMSHGDLPRLFDDFELGDQIYFSVNRGRFQLSRQAVRVFSASIGFDNAGNEIVRSIGVSPS